MLSVWPVYNPSTYIWLSLYIISKDMIDGGKWCMYGIMFMIFIIIIIIKIFKKGVEIGPINVVHIEIMLGWVMHAAMHIPYFMFLKNFKRILCMGSPPPPPRCTARVTWPDFRRRPFCVCDSCIPSQWRVPQLTQSKDKMK